MVDHSAKAILRQHRHPKAKLSVQQAAKLESMMARSYTDDIDVHCGALSAPRIHFRPGQRDDEVRCNFVGMTPIFY